ncbi:YdcF family protein [Alkalimonas amylolytica]|uniref:Uncharacterized SAM-binding protein YcdF, DUF218 family n=1 Tax=Alkalimonas amylolytica TaxID=152573 RepID=A0A1H4B1G2_ALKAM|nr:ElyC/SanA/YdcF family protein [Alkalimonas amylolytica]SEA41868.1 Uncharacterized SAM-binding protein YcdF, DUF218 family [Alkalimonas amylolytica]
MDPLLKSLLMPLPLLLLWLLLAAVLCTFKRKAGLWLLFPAIVALWLGSSSAVTERLAARLELRYPTYQSSAGVDNIIVLGCYHSDYTYLPLSSRLAECSLARLTEAIMLWHQHPEARLIVSGHLTGLSGNHTQLAADFAIALGVHEHKILRLTEPTNTQQEAASAAPLLVDQRNVLVTSAIHMPRAKRWFDYYGANVTAAPAHYQVRRPVAEHGIAGYLPSPQGIRTLTLAHYEYLGLWQQRLKLWWDPENP